MVELLKNPISQAPLPKAAERIIEEGERLIDELFATERNKRIPRYLPSNPTLIYQALKTVRDDNLALGDVYCEWGSGFGIGCCLAASLGFEAIGIELEEHLVDASRGLAESVGQEIVVHQSSYLPLGFDSYEGGGGEELILPTSSAERRHPNYEDTELLTEEVDVFFVYPWPGQQQFMLDLFDAVAMEGALLVAYFGERDISIFRKVSDDEESDEFDDY